MSFKTIMVAVAAVLLCIPLTVDAQSGEGQPSGQRVGKLPNGLSYFIRRGGNPGEKTRFALIVRAGDSDCWPSESGVAHLLEHIVVRKLKDIGGKGTIEERIARYGGAWGPDGNATTGFTTTEYFVRMPSNDPAALLTGLEILFDWASPKLILDSEIDHERKVVIEEARRGSTVGRPETRRAEWTTWFAEESPLFHYREDEIGTSSSSSNSIRMLHNKRYTPNNMAVVIVGDIDPDLVLKEVASRFAGLAPSEESAPVSPLRTRLIPGGKFVSVSGPDQIESKLHITFRYKVPEYGSAEYVKEWAAAQIINRVARETSNNLTDRIGSPITGAGFNARRGDVPGDELGIGVFSAQLQVRSGAMTAAFADLVGVLESMRRGGFTQTEIDRGRNLVRVPDEAASASVDYIAADFGEQFRRGHPAPASAELREAVRSISAGEVNAILKRWLDPAYRDVFAIYPLGAGTDVPSAEMRARLFTAANKASPIRLGLPAPKAPKLYPLERKSVDVSAVPVEDEGYLRWRLPRSGGMLFFKPNSGDRVSIVLQRKGGISKVDGSSNIAPLAVQDVAEASGVGGLDRFQTQRFFATNAVSLQTIVGSDFYGIQASGSAVKWPLLLQLVRTQMLRPACSKAGFDAFQDQIVSRSSNKAQIAADYYAKMRENALGDPPQPRASDLNSVLRFETICGLYRNLANNSQNTVIVVEGNLAAEEVHKMISANLDVGRARGNPRITQKTVVESSAGRDVFLGPTSSAKVDLVIQRSHSSNSHIGPIVGKILTDRLTQRLRHIESGTYEVHASVASSDWPEKTHIEISFECGPESVFRLIEAAKEELDRLNKDGPTSAEIALKDVQLDSGNSPQQIAERWLSKNDLSPDPEPTETMLREWITQNIDRSRVREFVQMPSASSKN